MRNFKRTLALVLALVMIVGTFATVSAAKTVWYDEAVDMLDNLGISNIGNTADEPITRNEFVLWIAKIETTQMSDNAWKEKVNSVVFSDVTDEHYNAAIAYANKLDYVQGHGDGTFGPEDTLLLGELSAIVTRLMRYDYLCIGIEEGHWAIPYFTVAARNCQAFDQVFYKNTDTSNMDYQLNKGEAAYVLYTICNMANLGNFDNVPEKDLILTDDGINLGSKLEALGGNMVRSELYYVVDMEREEIVSEYISTSNPHGWNGAIGIGGGYGTHRPTNLLSENGQVVLVNLDKTNVIRIDNEEFMKAARESLGLDPVRDYLNEEPEINVFETINVGTLVNINVSKDFRKATANDDFTAYGIADNTGVAVVDIDDVDDITTLTASENSVVVDTYLQLQTTINEKYVGYAAVELIDKSKASDSTNFQPVLPGSYNADLVTKWSDVVTREYVEIADDPDTLYKDETKMGKYTYSATLTFKGVEYDYTYYFYVDPKNGAPVRGDIKKSDIKIYDANWNLLSIDEAMEQLINVAQGECYAVFNDVDGDGEYDNVWIKESFPFHVANKIGVDSYNNDAATDYFSSVSKGEIVGNVTTMKSNAVGSIGIDVEVKLNYTSRGCTNAFYFESTDDEDDGFNKIQLVLVSSNSRQTDAFDIATSGNNRDAEVPFYYTAVELATIKNGLVEKVSVNASKGYYTAQIRVDGELQTVKIPFEAAETVKFDVTVAGVTETYTVPAGDQWFSFLADAADAVKSGIVGTEDDATIKANTAAWMAGRYVRLVTNEKNEVLYIASPVEETAIGFVTKVAKTNTGDNTYNVTVTTYETQTLASEHINWSTDEDMTWGALKEQMNIATDGSWSHGYKSFVTTVAGHSPVTPSATAEPVTVNGVKYVETNVQINLSSTKVVSSTTRPATDEEIENEAAAGRALVSVKTEISSGGKVGFYCELDTLGANRTLVDTTKLVVLNKQSVDTKVTYIYETGNEILMDGKLEVDGDILNLGSSVAGDIVFSTVSSGDKDYWVDSVGNKLAKSYKNVTQVVVSDVVTKEVRAAASGAFDVANTALYNEIFKVGTLINEFPLDSADVNGVAENGAINTLNDLIYVKLISNTDGAYILSIDLDDVYTSVAPSVGVKFTRPWDDNSQGRFGDHSHLWRWYFPQTVISSVPTAFATVAGEHRLGTEERKADRIYFSEITAVIDENTTPADITRYLANGKDAAEGYITESAEADAIGYIASYNVVYGLNPYYDRTWNAEKGIYEYELFYEYVVTDSTTRSVAMFAIDAAKTYMTLLFVGEGTDSKPVVADTPALKAEFPATEYYIDSNNYVFKVLDGTKITYKTDKNGEYVTASNEFVYTEIFDADGALITGINGVTVYDTVSFDNDDARAENILAQKLVDANDASKGYKALELYANFEVSEAAKTVEGYFPGLYTLTINGSDYVATESTEVVIVTPSADGFDTTVTTLAALKSTDGLFVTNWEANSVSDDVVITTIAVVGEMANAEQAPEEDEEVETNRLVYLDGNASAFIDFNEYADMWTVVSDKDAYLLPSGEAIGVIKIEYNTYTEAKAAVVDLALKGGEWYYVDENNTVAGSASVSTKTATITSATSNGTILATVEGTKNVNVSAKDVVFFFIKDGVLTIASDSTNVSVIAADAFAKLDDELEKAFTKAETKYEDMKALYNDGELSKERLDYYEGLMNDAEAALEAAQEANFVKYRDGQFWGYANNPVYKYLLTQQGVFQNPNVTVSFDYIMIGDTMCVLTDSFK